MIPIRNVYYLLCYAWDSVEEARALEPAGSEDFHRVQDLFGSILARGVLRVARKGLDRSYVNFQEELPGVRGKLELTQTLKQTALLRNRIVCTFDDLSTDVIHNQVVASTLHLLAGHQDVDQGVKRALRLALSRMPGVSIRPITRQIFARIQLDRNRREYRFLIHLCRLLHEVRLVDPGSGQSRFVEIDRGRLEMWRVFERFVTRFYAREQTAFRVRAQSRVEWSSLKSVGPASEGRIPEMRPDVVLLGSGRRIVLDAKYAKSGGLGGEDGAKLNSSNLYQLFAYVVNREANEPEGPRHEGILLYPTVGEETRVEFLSHGHRFQARSVDLARPWRALHEQLLGTLE